MKSQENVRTAKREKNQQRNVTPRKNSEEIASKRQDVVKKKSKLALHFDMLKMHAGMNESLADPMGQTEHLLSVGIEGKDVSELKSPLKNERIACLASQRDSKSSE